MLKKVKKVKGFVMNRKTGHTSYAFNQKDTTVKSLGFTHNKNDIAIKQKLRHNINPFDISDCYVKTKIEKQKFNTYRRKQEYDKYRIHNDDKNLINKIILQDKNKKRR